MSSIYHLQVLQLTGKAPNVTISDSDLLQAVLKWIEHDEPRRKKHVHELTKRINFSTLLDSHPHLLEHNILENDSKCSKILYKVFKEKALRGTALINDQTSPVIPDNKQVTNDSSPSNQLSKPSATTLTTPTAISTAIPKPSTAAIFSDKESDKDGHSSTSSSQGTVCSTVAKRNRSPG